MSSTQRHLVFGAMRLVLSLFAIMLGKGSCRWRQQYRTGSSCTVSEFKLLHP